MEFRFSGQSKFDIPNSTFEIQTPMQSFPIVYLLIPYALFIVVYFFFVLANLYHLKKFGLDSDKTKWIIVIYLTGTMLIFGLSLAFLSQFNWQTTVSFSDFFGDLNSTTFTTGL